MTRPLSKLSADALGQADQPGAQRAMSLWLETAHGTNAGEDVAETFACEAAFAVAARAVLEARFGERARRHALAFPHIYEPPLYAWYQPSRGLVEPLVELVNSQR